MIKKITFFFISASHPNFSSSKNVFYLCSSLISDFLRERFSNFSAPAAASAAEQIFDGSEPGAAD